MVVNNIDPSCGKPWDLHTEGTVGDTELPALHCPGSLETRTLKDPHDFPWSSYCQICGYNECRCMGIEIQKEQGNE